MWHTKYNKNKYQIRSILVEKLKKKNISKEEWNEYIPLCFKVSNEEDEPNEKTHTQISLKEKES